MTLPAGEADKDTRQNPTILVVEDDPLTRIAVAQHLRDAGYKVIEAATADEAVSVLSSGSRVHLVFADVELPGSMGGFSLAVWVRNHCRFVPVILTSGVGPVIRPLSRQHLVPFLEKPYRPEEAAELIASVLSSAPSVNRPGD
jgi:two-component system, response regulator PdtaR